MELQEKITALEAEKVQYIQMIDNVNAEKIALDQMLVEALKGGLESRKNSLLKDKTINDLNVQIQVLNKEKAALQQEKDDLRNKMDMLASNAQAIEG